MSTYDTISYGPSQTNIRGITIPFKSEKIPANATDIHRKGWIVMKTNRSCFVWLFLWSLFMGVTAISIGFGALFPSLNLVARPFVCPHGSMDPEKQVYRPYPGQTVVTVTWYCTDPGSGVKTEIGTFPLSLYAGTIYGVLLFVVAAIVLALVPTKGQGETPSDLAVTPDKLKSSEGTLARMKELKDLRTANLISEAEYEEKRNEILKSL